MPELDLPHLSLLTMIAGINVRKDPDNTVITARNHPITAKNTSMRAKTNLTLTGREQESADNNSKVP